MAIRGTKRKQALAVGERLVVRKDSWKMRVLEQGSCGRETSGILKQRAEQ